MIPTPDLIKRALAEWKQCLETAALGAHDEAMFLFLEWLSKQPDFKTDN